MPEVIVACCVLHNVCLNMSDDIDCDVDDAAEVEVNHGDRNGQVSVADRKAGAAKRDRIANLLFLRR